jgi:HK97 family phage major capsid protein/HK97 family phage prohead protease
MEPDFSGYATKAGLKCSDGRTILPGAFKHQDKARVPLVWQHGHSDPENVLGHTILENRDDGVYAYGYFNETAKATHAKGLLSHGDINMLSIWANELIERSGRVLHGSIREVSLVLSGANPGAVIETVSIRHGDDGDEVLDDEAIIYTGLEIEHADTGGDTNPPDVGGETIQDVYDTMNEKQKQVLHYMLGQALGELGSEDMQQDNVDDKTDDQNDKEGTGMTRNVFETGGQKETDQPVLSHADMKGILADATKTGSLKTAVENYSLSHGINQIDTLFPEATALTTAPEFFTRRTEWVNSVLNGARKTPFSRVKTHWADLTYDDARAKGYITGAEKQEEFYSMARRETAPQTIYKKQKLDRDDILDVTDFDVVAWMKGEMRIMLDEELARAILLGDGRSVPDPDKILEDRIRPIATDDPLFVITVNADLAAGDISDFVDAVIQYRALYRGTGTPTMYTSEALIAQVMLLKDTLGRRIYSSVEQFASELRVSSVVPVDLFDPAAGSPLAIIVNMNDYVIGADKGGQVSLFDDFDIDFNQYKYLIETRVSGALVKLKSAIVVVQGTFVAPPGGTDHVIVPEPPNERQSRPPVHGSLPDSGGTAATGATAGTPGTFTPGGSNPPANVAGMTGLTASPSSAWTTGQYVQTATAGTGGQAYWGGSSWTAGKAP